MQKLTDINYYGKVDIRYEIKGKQVAKTNHNNGCPNLFRTLCAVLAGYNTDKAIPKYIDLRVGAKNGITFTSILRQPVSLTNPSYENISQSGSADWVAKFNARIDNSNMNYTLEELNSNFPENEYDFRLYLVPTQTKDVDGLAYLTVDHEDIVYAASGTSILVTWTIGFSNKE